MDEKLANFANWYKGLGRSGKIIMWVIVLAIIGGIGQAIEPAKEPVAESAPAARVAPVVSGADLTTLADVNIMRVIRDMCKDPAGVDFEQVTYTRDGDNEWERKWRIKGENGYGGHTVAYGYAKIRFTGGDPNNADNWLIVKKYIDE
jgi:hypothetical protein